MTCHIVPIHCKIGPLHHNNAILPVRLHKDESRAGGRRFCGLHRADIHPGVRQGRSQGIARCIGPHHAPEARTDTKPGGRHRLVSPFAAGIVVKAPGEQGFPRPGGAVDPGHYVGVDTAEYHKHVGAPLFILL